VLNETYMEGINVQEHWNLVIKSKLSRYCHAGDKGERKYSPYSFLTSALDGGEWSALRPYRAFRPENDPYTHYTGGWMGLRAGLDTEARGKFSASAGDRTRFPGRPVCSQTLYSGSWNLVISMF
jgi:hypothetical protein